MKTPSFKILALNSPVWLVLCCALTATALPVRAQDLTGAPLQLNGTGVRHQTDGELYKASLYLDKKLTSPADVLSSPGAKQLRVVMLRDASAIEMGDLLARGIAANASDDELSRLVSTLFSLGEMFGHQKKLLAGDSLQIDWQPGKGTTIRVYSGTPAGQNATMVQSFSQPDLFGVMLRVWLGAAPVYQNLKKSLLGQAT